MKLPTVVRFADETLQDSFYALRDGDVFERELFKKINFVLDLLEVDAFCGVQIPKRLIPKIYAQNYNACNLWKYNLVGGWRLLYSIKSDEVIVLSVILEWLSHKEYERRFNY